MRTVARTRRRFPAALVVTLAALTGALGALAGCTPSDPTTPSPTPSHGADARAPYLDATLPTTERVDDLLARMDLADKVGQMTQGERGSVSVGEVTALRLGSVFSGGGSTPQPNTPEGWATMMDTLQEAAAATPLGIPLLYGVDATHGHQLLHGATVFPQNIGLGAAGDPGLAEEVARATAAEVRATGVNWTFAPCVAVVQDTRWGRSYESFGSDPALVAAMTSTVTGFQDEGVLATAKHYVADGGTAGGVDQGDAQLSEAELRAVHLPPYEAAVERGVGTVMVSFSSWNGEKLHGHDEAVTGILKDELGFPGFVVSDWAGIDQLDGEPDFTRAEIVDAVNAGIDMAMVPSDAPRFVELLTAAVEDGEIAMSRVDDAVRRILTVKMELGLFEAGPVDRSLADQVGSAEHRALARRAVAASQVVLSNDGTLPLAEGASVLVTGSNADDMGNQAGGWTITWQGASGDTIPGTTILDGLAEVRDVDYSLDGSGAQGHDVAVAVVGETPYAEFEGDRPDGVVLSEADEAVLDRLRASGVPTVLVVVSGRPMDLSEHLPWVSAAVASWLPGTAGEGVADVLTGAVPASGRLPVPWGDLPVGHGLT